MISKKKSFFTSKEFFYFKITIIRMFMIIFIYNFFNDPIYEKFSFFDFLILASISLFIELFYYMLRSFGLISKNSPFDYSFFSAEKLK